MKDEVHFYSSCKFYILKEGNTRKKCLNKYSEAKSYGAIACLSEVLSIASDLAKDIKISYDSKIIKDVSISFFKVDDMSYCDLCIKIKDKNYKKSIKDIKEQFINIDSRVIKVHNYKKENINYKVFLEFNKELIENYAKVYDS